MVLEVNSLDGQHGYVEVGLELKEKFLELLAEDAQPIYLFFRQQPAQPDPQERAQRACHERWLIQRVVKELFCRIFFEDSSLSQRAKLKLLDGLCRSDVRGRVDGLEGAIWKERMELKSFLDFCREVGLEPDLKKLIGS